MKTKFLFLIIFITLFASTHAQIQWQHTDGPEGGGLHKIWSNSSYAFTNNSAFLYRTSDNQLWEKMPLVDAYPFSVSDTLVITAKSKPGDYGYNKSILYYSKDNGNTWEEGSLPVQNKPYESLALCSHGIYSLIITDRNKFYCSKNYGASWDTIVAPFQFVSNLKSYDDKIFCELDNNLYEYNHETGQFIKLSNLPVNNSIYNYAVFGNTIFINCLDHNVYTSNDYGSTWSKYYTIFNNSNTEFIKAKDTFYYETSGTLIRKNNAFVPWEEIKIDSAFYIDNLGYFKNEILAVDFSRGCYKIDIPNHRLIEFNTGMVSGHIDDLLHFNDKIWVNTPTGIFSYDDTAWRREIMFPDRVNGYLHMATNNANAMAILLTSVDSIFVSNDYGDTWSKKFANFEEPMDCPTIRRRINWLGNNLILSDSYTPWCTMLSKNFGDTWEIIDELNFVTPFKNSYYAIKSEVLQQTNDLGESWIEKTLPGRLILYVTATKEKLFVFTYSKFPNGYVLDLYTSEDGENWTYSSDGLSLNNKYSLDFENSFPAISEINGIYVMNLKAEEAFISLDSCKTWATYAKKDAPDLVVDSMMYKIDYGLHKALIPDFKGRTVTGKVFFDENKNMEKDTNENYLLHYPILLTDSNGIVLQNTFTNNKGHYSLLFYDDKPVRVRPGELHKTFDVAFPEEFQIDSIYENLDFSIHLKPGITDISVDGFLNGRPRPGFNRKVNITLKNLGTIQSKGNLGVKLDKAFKYTSATPLPSSGIGTDSLTWAIDSLDLFSQQKIIISGYIDSFAILGNAFVIKGNFSPDKPDHNTNDNSFIIEDNVVGSFDPNEKLVYPAPGLTKEEIHEGKELIYTILFQNTGNYQADRVRITDLLDTALNVQTFRFIDASHPLSQTEIFPGQLLQFVFDNIYLPDSNSNEPESHGYVTFAIQRNKNYKESYIIKNTASIYFDFNHPIITNTARTPLYKPEIINKAFQVHSKNKRLIIVPIPANNFINVTIPENSTGKGALFIFNDTGQLMRQESLADVSGMTTISTIELPSGMYFVHLKTESAQYSSPFIIAK